jgi:hypothetical protein
MKLQFARLPYCPLPRNCMQTTPGTSAERIPANVLVSLPLTTLDKISLKKEIDQIGKE